MSLIEAVEADVRAARLHKMLAAIAAWRTVRGAARSDWRGEALEAIWDFRKYHLRPEAQAFARAIERSKATKYPMGDPNMSEAVPTPASDTLLESLRIRERELELEAVRIKASLEELRRLIVLYTSRARGGRRATKPAVVEQLHTRLAPFTAGDDPPDSAA